MPSRSFKIALVILLMLFALPVSRLPGQRLADRWPCPKAKGSFRHACTVGGRATPYILILIRNGFRQEVLQGIREDMEDSIDDSDSGTPQDLFDDIEDDFMDDQESKDPYDIGYFDIDELCQLRGTTFEAVIRAAVREEFKLDTRSTLVKKKSAGGRVADKLDRLFPQ